MKYLNYNIFIHAFILSDKPFFIKSFFYAKTSVCCHILFFLILFHLIFQADRYFFQNNFFLFYIFIFLYIIKKNQIININRAILKLMIIIKIFFSFFFLFMHLQNC